MPRVVVAYLSDDETLAGGRHIVSWPVAVTGGQIHVALSEASRRLLEVMAQTLVIKEHPR